MAEIFDPVWVSMFIIRVIFAIGIVFFMSYLILSYTLTLEDERLSRFAYEMEETIVASELAKSRGVFSAEMLDNFTAKWSGDFESAYNFAGNPSLNKLIILGDESPYINVEPEFARHCMFAYSISIRELGTERKWLFGYQASVSLEETLENIDTASETFPASVMHSDGRIEPAEMGINVYMTPLTRYSCLAERAKKYAKPQELGLPDCKDACMISLRNFASGDDHACTAAILDTRPGELSELACRYLSDTRIAPSNLRYGAGEKKKLVAYPVRAGAGVQNILDDLSVAKETSEQNCELAKNNLAANPDEVDSVVFCLEARR
ncbi:MAG: hypothetical protein HYW27_00630 [Candidatus Aenigmarchaeota archaeon]|nr:hypothetical protein [Candidatus Aenigmarchaeota archaeon]